MIINDREFILKKQPSKTYAIDFEGNCISGFIDDKEAIKQAIYKILDTQRYEELIYSWNYGIETQELAGQTKPYVCSELSRIIKEALTQDKRITEVNNFDFEMNRNSILVNFTVHTIFGEVEGRKEVST